MERGARTLHGILRKRHRRRRVPLPRPRHPTKVVAPELPRVAGIARAACGHWSGWVGGAPPVRPTGSTKPQRAHFPRVRAAVVATHSVVQPPAPKAVAPPRGGAGADDGGEGEGEGAVESPGTVFLERLVLRVALFQRRRSGVVVAALEAAAVANAGEDYTFEC